MRRKPAALRNIGIDRDTQTLDAFECDYPVELIHGCAHRNLSTTLRHWRLRFTEQSLLLWMWMWQVG